MAYGDFKDLARRIAADKVLRDKAFNIAKEPKYDGYQRGLASIVYKVFDKKTRGSGIKSMRQSEQLPDELHQPIIKIFKKIKVYSTFKDNIWGADLADMQLITKFNKGSRLLLCLLDTFIKYALVVPLKDRKGTSIFNAFNSILKDSNRKPNKIWADKGSEFYNNYFKKWLQDNEVVMYSTYNEGKSAVLERFIKTLKNKIYKYMTSISKKCVY